jgi:predicted HNH restriction endonuclease
MEFFEKKMEKMEEKKKSGKKRTTEKLKKCTHVRKERNLTLRRKKLTHTNSFVFFSSHDLDNNGLCKPGLR